ncbi:histidine kinase dimerization/phospho-acceptor domain-containing protein [Aurantimonas sp. Leaf443]|uniref:histidine kinase dimerization/phospho-acceptor domain-containing protein n=1 Tax=Aurantimonas sp. Leaf443 TaxID=1736378 RepID=UPI000AB0F617|nr:histidine kinase dimerization/phospho-acceptor domain-containing protein [Aurantimonas sp. Leaf443]
MAPTSLPNALEILSLADVADRDGPGAFLAVFSADLARPIFANPLAAALLGLGGPGLQDGAVARPSAALRQLSAASRAFSRSGSASALLPGAGRSIGQAATIALSTIEIDGAPFALAFASDLRAASQDPVAGRARLAAELKDASVALLSPEETLGEALLDEALEGFRAGADRRAARVLADGRAARFWRLAGDHVAAAIEAAPEAQAPSPAALAEAAADSLGGSEDGADAPRRSAIGALLERWHSRLESAVGLRAPAEDAAATEAAPSGEPGTGDAAGQASHAPAVARTGEAPGTHASSDERAPQDMAPDAASTQSAPEAPVPAALPAASLVSAAPRPALCSVWGAPVVAEPHADGTETPADAPAAVAAPVDPALEAEQAFPEPPAGTEEAAALDAGTPDEAPFLRGDAQRDVEPNRDAMAPAPAPIAPDDSAPRADEDRRAAPAPEAPALETDDTPGSVAAEAGAAPELPFRPRFDGAPVRFVWRIDEQGRFRSLSPEFAAAVGPRSADVLDLGFREVASAYGLDPDGEVQQLLERRDTWSGRTVYWPVENSARKAPIDLAALPVYARDRSFDGFRGFGIVRLAETIEDPDGLGLDLARADFALEDVGPMPGESDADADADGDPLTRVNAAPVSFGRRETPPESEDAPQKVIRLEERRRGREPSLSSTEEAAFRAIGATLGEKNPDKGLKEAIRAAAARVRAMDEAEAQATGDAAAAEAGEAEESVEEAGAPADLVAELDTLYGTMPLAVLVQVREALVYANARFRALTGHEAQALGATGGLARLFATSDLPGTEGIVHIRRADDETLPVRAHLQRLTLAGRSCLVMSFVEAGDAEAAKAQDERPEPSNDGDGELARLRRENAELRVVLDTATDGVVLLDAAGRIRAMNGSALSLFGIEPDDAAGRPFVTLFAHESQRSTLDYLETLKRDGVAGLIGEGREVIGRVAQGGFIPLSLTLGRLPDAGAICAVIRDIAHWKTIEQDLVSARREAEEASQQKTRFLANISHELRTPLNAIIGFADVMASESHGPLGSERYLEYLDDIKRSGHHLLDLVNDLLDLSKIEAGKVDLTFESVLLNDVIAEAVSLLQPQAMRERVIVRSNLPSSVPPVVADRRSIRQIALNLVSNAIRFTSSGGQIIVSTSYANDGAVVMRVRDSGIGMTESEIEIALTPFRQVRPGERGRGEGTGLGLPLTKALTEANRAAFAISSSPGEGTLVEISFPAQRVLAD